MIILIQFLYEPETEFKEFELLKFKPQLKYGWFHLKLYSMFQDSSRRLIETGFWRPEFIKFGHCPIFLNFYCKNCIRPISGLSLPYCTVKQFKVCHFNTAHP